MNKIYVDTGHRPYYIYITKESWHPFIEHLQQCIHSKKLLVICDENVHRLYYPSLNHILNEYDYEHSVAVIPPGETTKSLKWAEELYTAALNAKLDRQSAIVALGGGVVGDISGFIAATYMRGIDFVQIPTTLLAQIDSSIGGKVAVNHFAAKNIIGTFYQPATVYINIDTLKTLPEREFISGLAELIKYGYIWDHEFLNWIIDNIDSILAQDIEALQCAIYRACKIKSHIVSMDETEQGIRAILNFGHTIGHAVEASTGYSKYTHGEGVAMGMVYESELAYELGLIDRHYVDELITLLKKCSLPTKVEGIDSSTLIDKMALDKKNRQGDIVFILPTGAGKVDIFSGIDKELIYSILSKGCE